MSSKSQSKSSVSNLIIKEDKNEINWEQMLSKLKQNEDSNCLFFS